MRLDVAGLASDLSLLNKDCEASAEDLADIKRYAKEARCLIEALNPSFYAEIKTFKLCVGSIHTLCSCSMITEVLGQTNEDMTVTESPKFPQNWAAFGGCKSTKVTTVDEDGNTAEVPPPFILTSIDAGTNFIRVTPPVPAGQDVFVTVRCVPKDRLCATEEKDLSACADSAAIGQWALYRHTMSCADGDRQSISAATMHLKTFGELVGLRYRTLLQHIESLKNDEEDEI